MEATSRERVADLLAQGHYAIEPGITEIYWINKPEFDPDEPDEPDDSIALLEVNRNTLPCGIVPVYFRPHAGSGVLYPSVIIEVTPDEFAGGLNLPLPEGWSVGNLIKKQRA